MAYRLKLPQNYQLIMDIRTTEVAIKQIKDFFEDRLARELRLLRVSAPLFVKPETGLNDNLSGEEKPVTFKIKEDGGATAEIVHSLAKWKRLALKNYGFQLNEGLYTDMNAIRPDEVLDNIHSLYVDQWDWEKIISKEERTPKTLKKVVRSIYKVFKETEEFVSNRYSAFQPFLPEEIYFITAQELEDRYPSLTPKERENAIAREEKAVFIMQIGKILNSGTKHDGRAPDYDDWNLNGDIIFWNPILEEALELSSMGIRVDAETLMHQLECAGCKERIELPFHQALLQGELPYTMGGGIGQSRICMFFLQKAHIGEVHASIWPDGMIEECRQANIILL